MRLVDNDQVPIGTLERLPDLGVPFQGINRDDGPIELVEDVVMGRDPVPHPSDRGAIKPR